MPTSSSLDSLPASPEKVCPLLTGSKVPELSLIAADGAAFDLPAALRARPAALVFYRGGW